LRELKRRDEMFDVQLKIEDSIVHLIGNSKLILIHSSLSSMGFVQGGAETVVEALRSLSKRGITVMMPTLSYEFVTPLNPIFDHEKTPSNVGAISEAFRRSRGVVRSVHPTHSVCAIGPLAEELTAEHHMDRTPVGLYSPFRKLVERDGLVLFLGCGLRPNTLMHGVEEIVEPPYLFGPDVEYSIILRGGLEYRRSYLTHDFKGYAQRYDRIASLLGEGDLWKGRVLEAETFVLRAGALWSAALEELRRDEFAFVDRE